MAKPFDSSMKMLVEEYPGDWVAWLGYGRPPTRLIDADLATVTAATDKVVQVGRGKNQWLLLVEMLASYKAHIPERTHWHSTLLLYRHKLPVRSVIVLLRPEADGPAMTGVFEKSCPGETPYQTFRYQVIRLWQSTVDDVLRAGPGVAPLAAIVDEARNQLSEVVHRVKQRIERETTEAKGAEMLAATYVLMGLRYNDPLIAAMKREVLKMEESITYQEIVGIGQLKEARQMILRQGKTRFGRSSRKAKEALEAIVDLEVLESLGVRLLNVKSWEELLAS